MNFHQLKFDGALLLRGFWLYVWEIILKDGRTLHYVGKTGDKSSGKSQSPFDRLSKHLGSNKQNNALRRHLGNNEIIAEECNFRFCAYGPLFVGEPSGTHGNFCDIMSGLEKGLAVAMVESGYVVINDVKCRMPLDQDSFIRIRHAFRERFPNLEKSGQMR